MKTRIICVLIILFIAALLRADTALVSAENHPKRIRFQISTIEESADSRRVLAQTTIEGLPGTDFNINLQTGSYKMLARFLTDPVGDDKLKIRAQLDTRRLYGYSPINLPLYEEDNQKRSFEIGFNDSVVLLPFGSNGGAETLKIEITPSSLSAANSGEDGQNIKINFDKQIPSGEIEIEAAKIPHRFAVEAVLLADGKELAKGSKISLLEEEQSISLLPVDKFDNQIFTAKLTINKFSRNRPQDLVGINFGFSRDVTGLGDQIQPIISNGAGIGLLNSELSYPLDSSNLPGNKKYELKFRIRIAEDEK